MQTNAAQEVPETENYWTQKKKKRKKKQSNFKKGLNAVQIGDTNEQKQKTGVNNRRVIDVIKRKTTTSRIKTET